MAKYCVGIDLGGTFIKAALLDAAPTVRARREVQTPVDGGAEAVIEAMAKVAEELLPAGGVARSDVLGVGVGSPGPLDLEAGVVIGMPNIPGFENVPLRKCLAERLSLPVALENDANAAALGEYRVGSGQGVGDMVLLTLGTGVGSGIVIAGQLVHGAHGMGAEIGHLIVEPGGEPCGCGQRGCLERYASATYLADYARRLIEQEGRPSSLREVLATTGQITSKDVVEARRAGDALAAEVWDRAMRYLAVGCVSICRVLDPEMIVLGGGLAKAGEELLGPLRGHFERLHWKLSEPRTTLALAALGNDAGVIGAACVAWEHFGRP